MTGATAREEVLELAHIIEQRLEVLPEATTFVRAQQGMLWFSKWSGM